MRKDPKGGFGGEFPDFPGCVTAGRTLDEARHVAVEAFALHLSGMAEDGEVIPAPMPLDAILADPAYQDAVVVMVDAPDRQPRAIRVNVMPPEDLLRDIDRASSNRSRFLAEAARDKLRAA